ncbi:AP-1 complex subunit [Dirofilaria immitis]
MMQFMLLFSRQGKLRLQKWYVAYQDKVKKKITRELITTILARKPKMCAFLEYKDLKIVYKRYASLYFCCAIEQTDNELLCLEIIHRFVELLDKYFGSVCELDIIFNFEKAYFILDEFLLAGEIQETSKKQVLKAIAAQDLIQEEETPQGFFEDHGLGLIVMLIVGDRIEAGGNRGVIKYIGAVDGYDGEWIGIDWDNPERGKHDGFLNGKRYFQANSAKSGSFVRPTAVNAGRNLLEEMNNRYINYKQCDVIEFGSKNVDLVNMAKIYEKQNNLWELRVIAIDNMKVAKAPPTSCALFKYCTELNLYNNLLSQWCDLLDILCFFPSLRFLIAGRNYMEREMKSVVDKRIVSAPITILALGECRIDENTARKIMHFFPHVREIHLDRNDLKCFDPGEYGRNLESIDLEGNPINDFANLHVLSTLPNLRNLNLINCGLHHIHIPDSVKFSSLSSLNIKDNPIKDKQWISELAKFSKLERLCYSCSDNDNADFGIDLREIIIASIPQLKFLGNSEISSVERHSAEIRFLNKFGASPMTEENRSIVKRLIEVHGQPIDSSFMPCGGMDLLKLRLSYDGKIVERSLPTTVTVQRLIGIVSRLFHLDARKISLQVCDCHGFMMNLDKPSRSLDFYSLSDGNTIYATIV